MNGQTTIFDMLYPKYKITTPIRIIELFGGYGSQLMALKRLNANVEQWKLCEWAIKSIQAYKDIHCENDNTDYSKDLTVEQIKEYLFNKGISANYNEPMTQQQINRLNEKQVRTIYNNIKATHNLVNIQQVKGKDLCIKDTDKFTYLLTYSFPCQDLSLSGKRLGMSDTSTRSGMLWEVERILQECKDLGTLPQVLLMENVPQVKSNDPLAWEKWLSRLEELGYKNYHQDLIATDYGIPQTRNRCFMISILGDYNYVFPKPIPLKLKLKDMLEDNVDEKYYLSDKQIKDIQSWNAYEKPLENMEKVDKSNISPTLTTRSGAYAAGMILIKNATQKGYLEAYEGYGIDLTQPNSETRRGRVQKNAIQTLTTQNNLGVCVNDKPRVLGGIGEKDSNNNTQWKQQNRVYDNNVGIAITTCFNPNYIDNNLRIRKLTPRECFRLMGVKDEDFDKVAKNQSDSSLYHLAGDSIVVDVIQEILKELI